MKRWFILGCIIVMILPCFLISASATDYDFMDYITQITPTIDGSAVVIELPIGRTRFYISPSVGNAETIIGTQLNYPFQIYEDTGVTYDIHIEPNYLDYLLLNNVPDDTEQNIWLQLYSYDLETEVPGSTLQQAWDFTYSDSASLFFYLDKNHKRVATTFGAFGLDHDYDSFERDYYASGILKDTSKLSRVDIDNSYCTYSSLRFYDAKFHSHGSVGMKIVSYEIVLHINSLVTEDGEYDELLNEINDALADQGKKIDKLSGAIENLPNQIGDQFQNMQEEEKNEANSSGNGSVDQMIDIIPDYSTGLIEGVKLLANAISYEGTECKLTMPALVVPELPGVTNKPITFMKEQVVDLEVWFNRMPAEIMAVTKAMFEIAIVGFCFYELYDLIAQLANGARKAERATK